MQARERALPASRAAIRSCANAIRAIHRGELDLAHRLMDDAQGRRSTRASKPSREHPEIRFAGYLQDAQKEYAEARVTEASSPAPTDPDARGRSASRTLRT